MRIDRTHRSWLSFSVVTLAGAAAIYFFERGRDRSAITGFSSASACGLAFGIVGTAFMLFAALLSVRKKVRAWRIGSAQFWMRGHLWLGTLALPMLWFHAGFRHGGPLTSVLMWLLYAVIVTGLIGATIQHFLPRELTRRVPGEVTFEQIPQVIEHLQAEAELTAAACGPADGEDLQSWRAHCSDVLESRAQRFLITRERRERIEQQLAAAPLAGAQPAGQFYRERIAPFLLGEEQASVAVLGHPETAAIAFAQQREAAPKTLQPVLAELEQICGECRQLRRQARMHRWLHAWLLVHVPLSIALLVLSAFHVVVALRYAL